MKIFIGRCVLVFVLFLSLMGPSMAESIPEVARVSFVKGNVSLLPASQNEWTKAVLNRPLVLGDSVWVDADGRLEMELGFANLMLNNKSSFKILNLNNMLAQFQLSEGSMVLIVSDSKNAQSYEIDTPNLALTMNKPGYYRVDVDAEGTTVTIREGKAGIYGETAQLALEAGKTCLFTGTRLENYQCKEMMIEDPFDKWCMNRMMSVENTAESYTSPGLPGNRDLLKYGNWKKNQTYGQIWIPENTGTDWAPYRDGEWVWISGWGWTWIDNNPWGFAPFHYGRWVFIEGYWAWIPGPVEYKPVYAPALVVFVEAGHDGIAWFPLGPQEVYIPNYQTSPYYFKQINMSNTHIKLTGIMNMFHQKKYYQGYNFKNFHKNNGFTVISKEAFIHAKPVNKSIIPYSKELLMQAPKLPFAKVIPNEESILGGEKVNIKPPAAIQNKPAVIKTPPPVQPLPFKEEQKLQAKNPGKPVAPEEIKKLQPEKPAEMNKFKPVSPGAPLMPIKETEKEVIKKPVPAKDNPELPVQKPDELPAPVLKPGKVINNAPVVKPLESEPYVPQPKKIKKPEVQPEKLQAPVEEPVIKQPQPNPKKIQKPVVQPEKLQKPIEKPIIEQTPIEKPVIKQAPIEKPIIEQTPIEKPVIKQVPIEKPIIKQAPGESFEKKPSMPKPEKMTKPMIQPKEIQVPPNPDKIQNIQNKDM